MNFKKCVVALLVFSLLAFNFPILADESLHETTPKVAEAGRSVKGTVGLVCITKSGDVRYWFHGGAEDVLFRDCMGDNQFEIKEKIFKSKNSLDPSDSKSEDEKSEIQLPPEEVLRDHLSLWILCEVQKNLSRCTCPRK